jgi:hypothetical protein
MIRCLDSVNSKEVGGSLRFDNQFYIMTQRPKLPPTARQLREFALPAKPSGNLSW